MSTSSISYHRVLGEEECRESRSTLWKLRDYWIERGRHDPADFFTLGVATYLDVLSSSQPEKDYYQRLSEYNALLQEQFGVLLLRVAEVIQSTLGQPVVLAQDLALPGFHIFLGQAIFRAGTAAAHLDMQYEALRWPKRWDEAPPISFTLPIELPVAGAGLTTWPVEGDLDVDPADIPTEDKPVYNDQDLTVTYPYIRGFLVLQRGHVLHRIAPISSVRIEDERITLQGHGLRCGGEWILYW
jgi:hypothetical protein